jgi:hypothetical protein
LSVVSVVCFQVEVSATDWSFLLWTSDQSVAVCDQETSNTRRLKPATGLWNYNHKRTSVCNKDCCDRVGTAQSV